MPTPDDLYENYVEFKNWDRPPSATHGDEYSDLFKQAGLLGRLAILEIGSGSGEFLEWAKTAGHEVEGVELIPQLVASARKRGLVVHQAPTASEAFVGRFFDAVVAIDVFEHLDIATLQDTLRLASVVLKPNGKLVARFPNGASPFSGRWQNGDWTHTKPLSVSSISQIAIPTGMRFSFAFNPRPIPSGFFRKLKRRAVYVFRDIVEILISYAYYGDHHPLDPNIIVVLSPKPDGIKAENSVRTQIREL